MNVTSVLTKDYENKPIGNLVKTNPIRSQSNPIPEMSKMNVNSLITKDYRKKDDFAVQKTNPIQTQSNPISKEPK